MHRLRRRLKCADAPRAVKFKISFTNLDLAAVGGCVGMRDGLTVVGWHACEKAAALGHARWAHWGGLACLVVWPREKGAMGGR
mmetsp:Transcript_74275/g.210257  ORF Transcript_74275/g.210257 Transcript_74275/m.210257 type:complete len:83 (-) Transcript_74275:187-435(-)